jgi:hypothetical protein
MHRTSEKTASMDYLWTDQLERHLSGLGVLDLKTQNEALLIKNLHKFFNRLDIP